jgi:predicted anti-sigma-YlaC factor YlaD
MRFVQLRSLPMIGCRAAQRRLSDYLDEELREDEHRFVDLHLRRCARCRKVLRTLQAVVESLGRLPDDDRAPGSIADAVQRRLTPES